MNKEKIGLCITTFNSQQLFEDLFYSLPDHKYDELVVVNGGKPYDKIYKRMNGNIHWIQHNEVKNIATARNEGLVKLQELDCEHYFLFEDDVIVKSENIFDEYINASKISGLEYFCFASYAWESGSVGNRTPILKIQYNDNLFINLYTNTCNEASYRSRRVLEEVGKYDENYKSMFDIDWIYRLSQTNYMPTFYRFPDLGHADDLIMNNPHQVSRIDPEGDRWKRLQPDYDHFLSKHTNVLQIITDDMVVEKLKRIKPKV